QFFVRAVDLDLSRSTYYQSKKFFNQRRIKMRFMMRVKANRARRLVLGSPGNLHRGPLKTGKSPLQATTPIRQSPGTISTALCPPMNRDGSPGRSARVFSSPVAADQLGPFEDLLPEVLAHHLGRRLGLVGQRLDLQGAELTYDLAAGASLVHP